MSSCRATNANPSGFVGDIITPQLAAVLKAADAMRETCMYGFAYDADVESYDAAVADLRRVLEGK